MGKNQDYDEGINEGRFQMLTAIAGEAPEILIQKEVNRILDLPADKASAEMKKIVKKKNKTLKDVLIAKKVVDLFSKVKY